jgi:tellurite resistance protein TehA-like permease
MAGLIAFLLAVGGFIVRAVNHQGLELEDYVLWLFATLAALAFAPAVAYVQARRSRQPVA